MPRELEFRSEAARSAAIGMVMAIVLSGSMALAYALATARLEPWTIDQDDNVETRPVNVGPLTLSIPERFQQVAGSQQRIGFDLLIEFDDRLDPKRRLQVAAMGKPHPKNTLIALNRALNIMFTEELQRGLQQWNRVSQFRVGETSGASSNIACGSFFAFFLVAVNSAFASAGLKAFDSAFAAMGCGFGM